MIILDTLFLIDFFRNERLGTAIPDDLKAVVAVDILLRDNGRGTAVEITERREIFHSLLL